MMIGRQLQRALKKGFTRLVPQVCCLFALTLSTQQNEQDQQPPEELRRVLYYCVDLFSYEILAYSKDI